MNLKDCAQIFGVTARSDSLQTEKEKENFRFYSKISFLKFLFFFFASLKKILISHLGKLTQHFHLSEIFSKKKKKKRSKTNKTKIGNFYRDDFLTLYLSHAIFRFFFHINTVFFLSFYHQYQLWPQQMWQQLLFPPDSVGNQAVSNIRSHILLSNLQPFDQCSISLMCVIILWL